MPNGSVRPTDVAISTFGDGGLLEGIRVVDLTQFLAGPYGTMALGDLGADVIRIEDPDHMDEARRAGPDFLHKDLSLYFASLNWGKRSIGLRLSHPAGRNAAMDLVQSADVVVDNFRHGALSKIGLSHDDVIKVKPNIITCSLTGFGETGPLASQPGYDYTVQAIAGVMSLSGEPGGPPGKAGISYVDHSGGLSAAFAVCAALVKRDRTGHGCHIDLGLFDVQISMLTYLAARQLNDGVPTRRMPNGAHSTMVPAQIFQTADGYLTIFVGNDRMWSRLVTVVGDDRLDDPVYVQNVERLKHRDHVVALLQEDLLKQTTEYWVRVLRNNKVACGEVNDIKGALDTSQVDVRQLVQSADSSAYAAYEHVAGPVPSMGVAGHHGAPLLGEHTRSILAEIGYSTERVDELISSGAVIVSAISS